MSDSCAPQTSVQESLGNILSKDAYNRAIKELSATRSVALDDTVTFKPVEIIQGDKTYILTAAHVSVQDIAKYGQDSCRSCYGKGYFLSLIEKRRIPNPQDYLILSDKNIEAMPEPEKKNWIEVQKKEKMWKIMFPCRCALRKTAKVEPNMVSNEAGNIAFRITYQIKEVVA
jgi:hypothetical protein